MSKQKNGGMWVLYGLLLVLMSPFIYLGLGPAFDRHARIASENMCAEIQAGAPLSLAFKVANKHGEKLEEWQIYEDGVTKYVAMFSGFGANTFTCEVIIMNQIVQAKFIDEHTW